MYITLRQYLGMLNETRPTYINVISKNGIMFGKFEIGDKDAEETYGPMFIEMMHHYAGQDNNVYIDIVVDY